MSCVMNPASVGFDMSDVEIVAKLPEQVWNGGTVACAIISLYRLVSVLCIDLVMMMMMMMMMMNEWTLTWHKSS